MTALLFDLYGVLLRNQSPESLRAIERAAGQSGPEFWQAYWANRPAFDEGSTGEQFWAEVAKATGQPVADVPAAIEADFASWLLADDEMAAYVTSLAASGVRVGILSNIPESLARMIEKNHPWVTGFEPVLFSCRIGVAKPAPGAYAAAVEASGLPADEILFIDDRDENVDAAREAGLQAHLFTSIEGLRPVVDEYLAG